MGERAVVPGATQASPLEPIVGQHAHVVLDLAALDALESRGEFRAVDESVASDGVGEEPAHPLTLAASAIPRTARCMVCLRMFSASVWREW